MTVRLQDAPLRCPNPDFQGKPCRKQWALEVTRPWKFVCPRCKKTYRGVVDIGESESGIIEA